jgi:hypothetical protein
MSLTERNLRVVPVARLTRAGRSVPRAVSACSHGRVAVGLGEKDVNAAYRDGILEVRMPTDHQDAEAEGIPIARG